MNEFESLGFFDFEDFVTEMTDEQLIAVNGGACAGGGAVTPSTPSYTPHSWGTCSGGGAVTPSYPVPVPSTSCGGGCQSPTYTLQNYWDSKFGPKFGDHACAATSILNEIGEQFFKEFGRNMTAYEKTQAMKAAVEGGAIEQSNAFVKDWGEAATLMAKQLNMAGKYRRVYSLKQADSIIYAYDYKSTDGTRNPDGEADHFVSDLGNNKIYDPFNGKIKNLDKGILQAGNETRLLEYY